MSELREKIADRDWVDNHIRGLQAARHEREIPTDGWDSELLDSVVVSGLGVLDDRQLAWLLNNPVAMFQLHESVIEDGGDYWFPGLSDVARSSWMEIDTSVL